MYRADYAKTQADGAKVWRTYHWQTLARIERCRLEALAGDMRRAVYITGEADTYYSIPAYTRIGGKRITGYVTTDDDGNLVFRHCYH